MACLAVPVSYVNWFHRILKLGGICFKKLLTSLHKGESNRLAVLQVHLWQPLCSKFHVVGCSTLRQYCSVPGKLSWMLKHISRFWLAWAPTRDQNFIRLYRSCYSGPLKCGTWALTQEWALAWDTTVCLYMQK